MALVCLLNLDHYAGDPGELSFIKKSEEKSKKERYVTVLQKKINFTRSKFVTVRHHNGLMTYYKVWITHLTGFVDSGSE